jgi:hypothetical protein
MRRRTIQRLRELWGLGWLIEDSGWAAIVGLVLLAATLFCLCDFLGIGRR